DPCCYFKIRVNHSPEHSGEGSVGAVYDHLRCLKFEILSGHRPPLQRIVLNSTRLAMDVQVNLHDAFGPPDDFGPGDDPLRCRCARADLAGAVPSDWM